MTNQTSCPDCGVGIGQPHVNNCDIERCSVCGDQRISCGCEGHNPTASAWLGEWPTQELTHNKADEKSDAGFRVSLRARVEVKIELDARSEQEAKDKAVEWINGFHDGWREIGYFYSAEDGYLHCCHDEQEMYWEIVAVDPDYTLDVIQLNDDSDNDSGLSTCDEEAR